MQTLSHTPIPLPQTSFPGCTHPHSNQHIQDQILTSLQSVLLFTKHHQYVYGRFLIILAATQCTCLKRPSAMFAEITACSGLFLGKRQREASSQCQFTHVRSFLASCLKLCLTTQLCQSIQKVVASDHSNYLYKQPLSNFTQ